MMTTDAINRTREELLKRIGKNGPAVRSPARLKAALAVGRYEGLGLAAAGELTPLYPNTANLIEKYFVGLSDRFPQRLPCCKLVNYQVDPNPYPYINTTANVIVEPSSTCCPIGQDIWIWVGATWDTWVDPAQYYLDVETVLGPAGNWDDSNWIDYRFTRFEVGSVPSSFTFDLSIIEDGGPTCLTLTVLDIEQFIPPPGVTWPWNEASLIFEGGACDEYWGLWRACYNELNLLPDLRNYLRPDIWSGEVSACSWVSFGRTALKDCALLPKTRALISNDLRCTI